MFNSDDNLSTVFVESSNCRTQSSMSCCSLLSNRSVLVFKLVCWLRRTVFSSSNLLNLDSRFFRFTLSSGKLESIDTGALNEMENYFKVNKTWGHYRNVNKQNNRQLKQKQISTRMHVKSFKHQSGCEWIYCLTRYNDRHSSQHR